VMDDHQVPEKELRCEACGRVIKPERDEKVERVTDEKGVVRVFCELNLCRQERLQVHIRAFNARIAPERTATASPPKPMVRICESCGREIKVERGEQSHPVWQKNGVIRMFCTLPMCDLDARVVEEEEERAKA
jgi:DNA-directed RNA polymerase subunit N (RpoN/RPB10)